MRQYHYSGSSPGSYTFEIQDVPAICAEAVATESIPARTSVTRRVSALCIVCMEAITLPAIAGGASSFDKSPCAMRSATGCGVCPR